MNKEQNPNALLSWFRLTNFSDAKLRVDNAKKVIFYSQPDDDYSKECVFLEMTDFNGKVTFQGKLMVDLEKRARRRTRLYEGINTKTNDYPTPLDRLLVTYFGCFAESNLESTWERMWRAAARYTQDKNMLKANIELAQAV